jgi:hypothetical protein
MKKYFILTYLLVLATVAVWAQQAIAVTDPALKVDLITVGQAYPSEATTFQITIKSTVDSGRATVQWYWPTNFYDIEGATKDNITLISGNLYNAIKVFDPLIFPEEKAGVRSFTIGVKVTALVYEQNYLTIFKKTFFIDGNMQILPITDTYREAKTTFQVNAFVVKAFSISVVMIIIAFILKKFINYVNSPDKEK